MKPLTRKEMLLDGMAKGNLDDFKPATREEVFAKRALANTGGDEFVVNLLGNANDGYQVDKTFVEVLTACNENKTVKMRHEINGNVYWLNLAVYNEYGIEFACGPYSTLKTRMMFAGVALYPDGAVDVFSGTISISGESHI